MTVTKATPTVTTIIHAGSDHATGVTSVLLGTTVHDSASVSGLASPVPGGDVTFSFFDNNTCTAPAAATSSAFTLISGSVDGTTFTQTPGAGGKSFQAYYTGDTNYLAADGACEPLFVTDSKLTLAKSSLHREPERAGHGELQLPGDEHRQCSTNGHRAGG